jgi:hypothetical protein
MTIKTSHGERPGLWYLTTLHQGVWTVEERRQPEGYGGGWAWYATRNHSTDALDPMPRLRDVKQALAELDARLMSELAWTVGRQGRRWIIEPLSEAADLVAQDVGTPSSFPTKREALEWVHLSLESHRPDPARMTQSAEAIRRDLAARGAGGA